MSLFWYLCFHPIEANSYGILGKVWVGLGPNLYAVLFTTEWCAGSLGEKA